MPNPVDTRAHCRVCLSLRIFVLIFYLSVLTWLSLTSSPPSVPGPLGWDKLLHTAAYTVLAVLTLFVLVQPKGRRDSLWWQAWLFAVAFGILMEILQVTMTPNRAAEFTDIIADVIGATLACVLFRHRWRQVLIRPFVTESNRG